MSTSVQVHPASVEDVDWIARHLRDEDREEVRAATGKHPVAALLSSYVLSEETYKVELGRERVALFGIVRQRPGIVWMLCTPQVTSNTRGVLEAAEGWVNTLSQRYGGLQALAWANNYLHVRWCKHLGFVELGSRKILNGQQFIHLYRPNTNV